MRRATQEDIPAIAEMEMLLFPSNCMNETTLKNELEVGECWLCVEKEEILGYCLVRREHELLDVLRLGVLSQHRRKGVATSLLEHVIKEGCPAMLTVKRDNKAAMRLYLRHGFRIVGLLAADNGWVMKRATSSST